MSMSPTKNNSRARRRVPVSNTTQHTHPHRFEVMYLRLVFFVVYFHAANRLTGVSVFVGNLPASTKRTQLEKLFTPHAKVLRIRFRKPNGGQLFKVKRTTLPSLIAFVDVATNDEAKAASAALHQTVFQKNILRVSSDKWENSTGNEKRTVFVGNLTYGKWFLFVVPRESKMF